MTPEEIKAAVEQFPSPEEKSGVLVNADKKAMDAAVLALHKAGKPAVAGLIDLLVDTDPAADSKARHAIHALVHYTCGLKDENARAALSEALAAGLQGKNGKEVKVFLIHQLRLCGGKEVVAKLGEFVHDDDTGDPATAALLSIKEGAAAQFRAALPKCNGHTRLAVIQALAVLRDNESLATLREAAKDEDRDTRIAARHGLAAMGDAASVDLLIKATATEGWERVQAVKHCLICAEHLAKAGNRNAAGRLYRHLHDSRTDAKEAYVKDAALRGLTAAGMKLNETTN